MNAIDGTSTPATSATPVGISAEAGERLRNLRIMINGVGNIGSFLALFLAPLVGFVRLVDRGIVKPHNAGNQIYAPSAIDRAKVDAMAKLLTDRAPRLEIDRRRIDLEDLAWGDFTDIDVVTGALDSLRGRQILSEHAYPLLIPYIDGGVGDELATRVQVLLPRGACLECDWSAHHYRQVATENPCHGNGDSSGRADTGGVGYRTLAPSCVGAATAAMMVAQLIRLASDAPPVESYEITGAMLPGRFIASRRRRNAACRFHHQVQPPEFGLDTPFSDATVGDVIQMLRMRYGTGAVQVEARRGVFPQSLFANTRHVDLDSLIPLSDIHLSKLGLTDRDRLVVNVANRPRFEHMRLGASPRRSCSVVLPPGQARTESELENGLESGLR